MTYRISIEDVRGQHHYSDAPGFPPIDGLDRVGALLVAVAWMRENHVAPLTVEILLPEN